MKVNIKKLIFGILAAVSYIAFLFMQPFSDSLSVEAMRVLGTMIAAIFLWAGGVFHETAVVLFMSASIACLGKVPIDTTLAAFSGTIIWTLIGAFILGAAMKKTGLLVRVAYLLLRLFPKSYAGNIIGAMVVNGVISPFLPSKNAKGAIMAPIFRSICDTCGYKPGSKQYEGVFLAVAVNTAIMPIVFISASLTTTTLINTFPEELIPQFTFARWALDALPMFIPLAVMLCLYLIFVYRPKKGEKYETISNAFIEDKLKELGPWSKKEIIVGVLAILLILYWIFKKYLGNFPDYATAIICAVLLWVTDCVDAKTVRTGVPWESLIFIGCAISLCNILPFVGIDVWVTEVVGPFAQTAFSNPYLSIIIVALMVFVMRFLILSENGFLPVFCTLLFPIAASVGVGPFGLGMVISMMVPQFLFPYQSSVYLSTAYGFGADVLNIDRAARFWIPYMIIGIIACLIACPIWQAMGLWYL